MLDVMVDHSGKHDMDPEPCAALELPGLEPWRREGAQGVEPWEGNGSRPKAVCKKKKYSIGSLV